MTHFSADGHINIANEQKRQTKPDTRRSCGKSLVSKGEEIKTRCEVNFDVIPTWENVGAEHTCLKDTTM